MSKPIPENLRVAVAQRAAFCCEYCRIPDLDAGVAFHVDHIISVKHGGKSIYSNLAFCCPECNRYKGSDLGTYLDGTEKFIPFFNPRKDDWTQHFLNDNGTLRAKTEIGEATVLIFKFNKLARVFTRQQLAEVGLYPV